MFRNTLAKFKSFRSSYRFWKYPLFQMSLKCSAGQILCLLVLSFSLSLCLCCLLIINGIQGLGKCLLRWIICSWSSFLSKISLFTLKRGSWKRTINLWKGRIQTKPNGTISYLANFKIGRERRVLAMPFLFPADDQKNSTRTSLSPFSLPWMTHLLLAGSIAITARKMLES